MRRDNSRARAIQIPIEACNNKEGIRRRGAAEATEEARELIYGSIAHYVEPYCESAKEKILYLYAESLFYVEQLNKHMGNFNLSEYFTNEFNYTE